LERAQAFFANSSLRRLFLSNCGLSAEGMTMLNTYFMNDDGRVANTLRELVLDRNMVGADGAEIVGEFLPSLKNLEYFSFNGCRPKTEGTLFLSKGLMNLTKGSDHSLRRIDMEDCTFGEGEEDTDAIFPLCKAIARCSQLQSLNIADGALEISGIKLLVSALEEGGAKLTQLNLSKSLISLLLMLLHMIASSFF
jgi:Ran GTPase-activating protein (RanGAP) involved in mRNA processing and transport